MSVTLVGAYCLMKTSVVFTYNHRQGVAKNTLHPQADANLQLAITAIQKANEIYVDEVKTILINVRQTGVASDGFSHYADIKVSFLLKSEFTDKVEAVRLYSATLDADTGTLYPKHYQPNTHVTKAGVYINEVSARKLVSKDVITKNTLKSFAGYIIGNVAYAVRSEAKRIERENLERQGRENWASKIESYVEVTLAQMKTEVASSLGIEEDELEVAQSRTNTATMQAELYVAHTSNNVKVGLRKDIFGNQSNGILVPQESKWELTASQAVTKNALAKVAGLSIL